MKKILHLARLESPRDALRVACGAWREPKNWTTVRDAVTCPSCLALIRAGAVSPPDPVVAKKSG